MKSFKSFLGEDDYFPIECSIQEAKKHVVTVPNKDRDTDALEKHYHPSKYKMKHILAIAHYTGGDYKGINGPLNRTGNPSKKHAVKVADLDDALHAVKAPHDITVYSGIHAKHAPHVMRKAQKLQQYGNKPIKLVHRAYTSTTIDHELASNFAGDSEKEELHSVHKKTTHHHVLKIHIPKGHPGAYVGNPALSDMPDEQEFILPRGTKFHVNPRPETKKIEMNFHPDFRTNDPYRDNDTYVHTWHAKVVR